jgi:hypothetical protein
MILSDLDRPPITWHYDRWGQDVVFRPISALALAKISSDHPGVTGADTDQAGLCRFYAELLALSVESPVATLDEWLQVSAQTLAVLGDQALRVNGLLLDEDTKKN